MSYFSTGFSMERKMEAHKPRFYGKYRAKVTAVGDKKDKMGRIKVKCPAVLGDSESQWCVPCVPFAGVNRGMFFMPKVGDTVWVEFEGGDPNLPIWVGSWFALHELPARDEVYKKLGNLHVIETGKTQIIFDDSTGELKFWGKERIVINNDLVVNGQTTINNHATINGRTTINNHLNVAGNVSAWNVGN